MKLLIFFTACLLAGLAYSAPTSEITVAGDPPATNDEKLIITDEFFPESLVVYTAEHDIVKILTPLNALNDDNEDDDSFDMDFVTFIVQADINENGEKVDQGLYILKKGQATKLLDNGRDAAAANDETKTAYFAAKDGLYSYNATTIKAEKYGTVTDDLIGIAKVNGSDIIYVLTADNVVYKITEEGTKKEVVAKVVKAKEIILDYQHNLYFYTDENIVYVLVGDEVRKIEGLPANPNSVKIINPPFIIENGVPVIVDNKSYIAYENGTSELGEFEFTVKPTAYSMEATLVQYYGYNKKVYEYNILTLILGEVLLAELKGERESEILAEFLAILDGMTDSDQAMERFQGVNSIKNHIKRK